MATKKLTRKQLVRGAKKLRNMKLTRVSKLAAIQTQYNLLKEGVRQYVTAIRYQAADKFKITLPAKTGDKDTMIRVSSLMSAVITAKGLGKEVRVNVQQADDGGTMLIEFYTPAALPPAVASANL